MKKRRAFIILLSAILCFSFVLCSCRKNAGKDGGGLESDGNREEEKEDFSGNPDDKAEGDPYENDKEWF